MKNEDQHIINGCLTNDRQAQHQLYNKYARWGLTICRRYVSYEEKAQESLQDGFLKIFTKIDTYDANKGELKAWMARIFINCALSITKKEAFNNTFNNLEDLHVEPSTEADFFKWNAEEILKLLKRMPIGYKTVFNMYVIDDYSHKEIAKHLNISEITSRSQLRKAKLWIKENVCLDEFRSRLES